MVKKKKKGSEMDRKGGKRRKGLKSHKRADLQKSDRNFYSQKFCEDDSSWGHAFKRGVEK